MSYPYGTIVKKINSKERWVIMGPASKINPYSKEDYFGILESDLITVASFNDNEITYLDEYGEDLYIAEPVFPSEAPLGSFIVMNSSMQHGQIIAIKPIQYPLRYNPEYLIQTQAGDYIIANVHDFKLIHDKSNNA